MDDTLTRLVAALGSAETLLDKRDDDLDLYARIVHRLETEVGAARAVLRLCAQDMAAAYGNQWSAHPLYGPIRKALGDD